MSYNEVYNAWKNDPESFWLELCKGIEWDQEPTRALFPKEKPFYSWFDDGLVNTCWNAVDRHVIAGRGNQPALIYDSPVTGTKSKTTYAELLSQVARVAGALASLGVEKGDRVVVYMPMIPEAVVAMLACSRIGAIHSVVFGGFAAQELAVRIDDAKPSCILTASCGIEPNRLVEYKPLLDKAIELARFKPQSCVIYQREQCPADLIDGRDFDWNVLASSAKASECVPLPGNHPLYILYTSGTTGQPKGVIRPSGGHLVVLNWTMKNFYGVDPGEVFWAASDVGWVVGHSYICYAPLIHGNTSVIYEGKPVGTPDAGAFWRVISEHKVSTLFTAPTAFRAIKRVDPKAKLLADYDMSSFKTLFLAGERADPDTLSWAERHLKVPVIDHWWQTETGWPITGNPIGIELLPIKHGSSFVPMPGYDIQILDNDGLELPRGELGSIAVKLPLPPGNFPTLWKADQRYIDSYLAEFPGYYNTGDAGYMDENGYVYIMARTDDVINVAGHRLSTGGLEEVIASHPDVAECAVIGAADKLKGQLPLGFVCLNSGSEEKMDQVIPECIQLVREKIGPVAAFKQAVVVDRLPKTRSGKILRGTMVKIANGESYKAPATIDDPVILEEITAKLATIGYPKDLT